MSQEGTHSGCSYTFPSVNSLTFCATITVWPPDRDGPLFMRFGEKE